MKIRYNPTKNINRYWLTDFSSLKLIPEDAEKSALPERVARLEKESRRAEDWKEFAAKVPMAKRWRVFDSLLEQDFKVYLLNKYGGVKGIRKHLLMDFAAVRLPFEDPFRRGWTKPDTLFYKDYVEFLASRDISKWTVPILFDGEFILYLKGKYPNIDTLNKKLGTHFSSYSEITFTKKAPANGLRKEWVAFLAKRIPLEHCVLKISQARYAAFLEKEFNSDFNRYKSLTGDKADSFEHVVPPEKMPPDLARRAVWNKCVTKWAKPDELLADTTDIRFRDEMRKKYRGDIKALNAAWGTNFASFAQLRDGVPAFDVANFEKSKTSLRLTFLFDNYAVVWRYIAVNGRALWNTLILCFFTVLAQLTVNPLCAYALSRYKLKHTYKILMFFIATMAFPPMVLMIPNFVMLRDLGMLNTYWALIIPSMANGYYIFLMKGFFDSLPKELYEAAAIEGANEFHMFFRITLPLVKPIMAVKALGAFTAAYGGFMWAFVICQDPRMWTIMVYIYQFQQGHPYHLVMTALLMSSIPLLIMFIFCQKIIMRGIVIPVMK